LLFNLFSKQFDCRSLLHLYVFFSSKEELYSAKVNTTNMLFPELYTNEIFQLLVSAYSTISVEDVALFLGMSEDAATSCK